MYLWEIKHSHLLLNAPDKPSTQNNMVNLEPLSF